MLQQLLTDQLIFFQEEQKYKITLLTVYSLDLIDQYLLLLGKICSYHEQPLLHLVSYF